MTRKEDLYATATTVGEWDGQEALAAVQFNRIVDALAATISDESL